MKNPKNQNIDMSSCWKIITRLMQTKEFPSESKNGKTSSMKKSIFSTYALGYNAKLAIDQF